MINVVKARGFIEIDNGLVKVRFGMGTPEIKQTFFAQRNNTWIPIADAFVAPTPRPAHTAPLYAGSETDGMYRHLVANTLSTLVSIEETPAAVHVVLVGALGKARFQQTVTVEEGRDHVRIAVDAALDAKPPQIEYLLSCFVFSPGEPDFVHTPLLKQEAEDVISDRSFWQPALILQQDELLCAVVPDLDAINDRAVYAKQARQPGFDLPFRLPENPDKISMPTAFDLNRHSGMTPLPLLAYGLIDSAFVQHVHWHHSNDGSMVRELASAAIGYAFDLFLMADALPKHGYQRISRYMWQRYGSRYLAQPRPQAMPFAEYARLCYPAAFAYRGFPDRGLATWQDFTLDGQQVGGLRCNAAQWYYDLQFLAWFNIMRDAIGMHYWGKRLIDADLIEKGRRVLNLALLAPQHRGIFPSIYRLAERRWIGCLWSFPQEYDARALPHAWDVNSSNYHTPAASKTCVHLLRYRRLCEDDARILPFVRAYGDFLMEKGGENGCVPSWFSQDLQALPWLATNAEGGIHIWFLSELYGATGERRYLDLATHLAQFLIEEILPDQRWIDFETFYSCSRKPEAFRDEFTGQGPRCTLSMIWAIEGLVALFGVTGDDAYREAAEAVADYASFYQAVWQPHFIITAYAFGGCGSQNTDVEWVDMRQSQMGEAFVRLGVVSERQDLLERGVALVRAQFALTHHPRHIGNGILTQSSFPIGLGPENIDHEGVPQEPLRTHPDWAEVGGLAAAATILDHLGSVFVQPQSKIAVGVDGVHVRELGVDDDHVFLHLTNQLAALPMAYDKPYPIEICISEAARRPLSGQSGGRTLRRLELPAEQFIEIRLERPGQP